MASGWGCGSGPCPIHVRRVLELQFQALVTMGDPQLPLRMFRSSIGAYPLGAPIMREMVRAALSSAGSRLSCIMAALVRLA